MGNSCSKPTDPGSEQNRIIEKQISIDGRHIEKETKLLLLGAGESGKSTIMKQMKILHQDGYTQPECEAFREIVWSNTIQSMQVLCRGSMSLMPPIPWVSKEMEEKAEYLMSLPAQGEDFQFSPEIAAVIKELWACQTIKDVFARSSELQLNDSAQYYFDAIDRLANMSYIPDLQDILRSRVKTTGISEMRFSFKDMKFRVFDVGGQRSERRKWIHCFEDVQAVMFCAALSEYDLFLREDEDQNRMLEALTLFDNVCNSRWFAETSIMLFLNKVDLFREKIGRVPLSKTFEDYKHGPDPDKAAEFISRKFLDINKTPEKKTIYPHLTCATDTENIRFVWAAVNDMVVRTQLRKAGMI
ncbi:guanine nucleotide-binding protein G(I) subunit alpha [Fonticula alba]|uniref:Guanine nucleotide-binding protein G(I) subunit alpha n=1 Tax=Fonticula alba TaxID=691883 RepID=A0A058ZCN9_FONAL|nr:guanine nucleotide-binding protein G(I) subunit alpha [Fonticula alba]KCV71698.1 guanine nucleotide-binding protein G(I) subunit alpha [Fonticula alba]|eukprot:XP_009493276.1 guanine nucleotide-binding protein G(I) subunit alpha [Fonticula alba]